MNLEIVGAYFTVLSCPRCDDEHAELEFTAVPPKPVGDPGVDPNVGDFWTNCPVNGESLLLHSDRLADGDYELTFDLAEPS